MYPGELPRALVVLPAHGGLPWCGWSGVPWGGRRGDGRTGPQPLHITATTDLWPSPRRAGVWGGAPYFPQAAGQVPRAIGLPWTLIVALREWARSEEERASGTARSIMLGCAACRHARRRGGTGRRAAARRERARRGRGFSVGVPAVARCWQRRPESGGQAGPAFVSESCYSCELMESW